MGAWLCNEFFIFLAGGICPWWLASLISLLLSTRFITVQSPSFSPCANPCVKELSCSSSYVIQPFTSPCADSPGVKDLVKESFRAPPIVQNFLQECLTPTCMFFCARWNAEFPACWLRDLHIILYTDDIMLLATSREELQSKLRQMHEHLALVGLCLAKQKCQFLVPEGSVGPPVTFMDGTEVSPVSSVVFLGVLVGFDPHPLSFACYEYVLELCGHPQGEYHACP